MNVTNSYSLTFITHSLIKEYIQLFCNQHLYCTLQLVSNLMLAEAKRKQENYNTKGNNLQQSYSYTYNNTKLR